MDAHFLRQQVDPGRRAPVDGLAVQVAVDGHGRFVTVCDRCDDVLGPVGRVAAEEHVGHGGLERVLAQNRQTPFVERDPAVLLDPGECVLLAHGHQHRVALEMGIRLAGGHQGAPAFFVVDGTHDLERHAGELAVRVLEALGHVIVQDRNALVNGIFLLPRRGFHLFEAAAHDDLDVGAPQPARGAAAVHRRVATAQDDDPGRHAGDVSERHRREPVDADVDVLGRLATPWHVQIASTRRAATDKHGVKALFEQAPHRLDAFAATEPHPHVEDVAGFLVDDRFGQAKAGNLGPDETAGLGFAIEHRDLVTQRRQIARHGQRRRPCPNASHTFAVGRRNGGHARLDVGLVVRGHPLQAADGHRLGSSPVVFFHPAAPTSRFARSVARSSEHARKNVGHPVDHVGVAVATLADQPDVLRHGCVGRTGPLAIDDLVEIVRSAGVCWLQDGLLHQSRRHGRRHGCGAV